MSAENMIAVVGMAEHPTGWFPDKSCFDLYLHVTKGAILDAGIDKNDIDAMITMPPLSMERDKHEVGCGRIVEELGLNGVKYMFQVNAGGSTTAAAKIAAKSLLNSGAAKFVIIVQAQSYSSVTKEEMVRFFSTNSGNYEEWEYPYGMTYNNMVALIAQRYAFETGLTERQRASLVVSLRKWAVLNPNARFRKPLNVDDVLNSKMVSTPLHAYELNILSDGAGAFIVTKASRAKKVGGKPPVYILAEGHGGVSHFSMIQKPDRDFTRFGYDKAAKIALLEAGITIEDVDVAEIYGSYPIMDLIEFEDVGFAKRGDGGKMYDAGETSPGGKIPVNTNGEIQQGHSGLGVGMATFLEGVRQIRGDAGERQVRNAKICLVTVTGGQVMDSHVTVLGKDMP